MEGGVGIVEMLYNSNIIAFIGTGESTDYPKNKLFMWDASKSHKVCCLTFNCNIIRIKLKNDKYDLFLLILLHTHYILFAYYLLHHLIDYL